MDKNYIRKKSTEDLKAQSNVMQRGDLFNAIIDELWRRKQHEMVLSGLRISGLRVG